MKSVTKIILYSCVFVYGAGLWVIASRFGLVKLITRYGLAESFDQIPKDFPQVEYLYIGLIGYTILFAILTYFIVKYSERTVKEQAQLQQEAAVVASFAEKMNLLLSQYERSDVKDANTKRRLQTLARQIASLPPAVVRNASSNSEVSDVISELQDILMDNSSVEAFSTAIENARSTIDSIKRRSITLNY